MIWIGINKMIKIINWTFYLLAEFETDKSISDFTVTVAATRPLQIHFRSRSSNLGESPKRALINL